MRTHPSNTRCRISSFTVGGRYSPSGNVFSVAYATSARGDVVRDTYVLTASKRENGNDFYKWVLRSRGELK